MYNSLNISIQNLENNIKFLHKDLDLKLVKNLDFLLIYQVDFKTITNYFYDDYYYNCKKIFKSLDLNYMKLSKKHIKSSYLKRNISGENIYIYLKKDNKNVNIFEIIKNLNKIEGFTFKFGKIFNRILFGDYLLNFQKFDSSLSLYKNFTNNIYLLNSFMQMIISLSLLNIIFSFSLIKEKIIK